MRAAIIIAPPHDPVAEIPLPVVHLRERLALSGFNVVNLATTLNLSSHVADATSIVGEEDSVFFYFAARTRLDDDGKVAILTRPGGDETQALALFGEVLRARGPREVFIFADVEHDGMADDVMRAAEHVDAIVTALGVREAQHSLLVGAHAAGTHLPDWPLTRFFLDLLDDVTLRDEQGNLPASRVYEKVREDGALAARVPSFALLGGATNFALYTAPALTKTPSKRPSQSSMLPAPSEAHRSLRPIALPALDPILVAAAEARAKNQWDRALEEYKKALMVVPADDAAAKASIYAYVGEVKRAQGKPREAELNFEKALREMPEHRRSIEMLVAIATEAKEWPRVVEYRRALAGVVDDPKRRAAELVKIAGICETELSDKGAAAKALEEARELLPRDVGLLQRLRALYEATFAWGKVLDVLSAIVDTVDGTTSARAELRFQQADVTLAHLRDDVRGCALLEKVLEDDPMHEKALSALIAVRGRREEYVELERALLALTARLAQHHELERAAEVCTRLAALRRDRLVDGPGAIEAYRAALRCKPSDADARAMLAELLVLKGDLDLAVRELEAVSRFVPMRVATYKRLFELHTRAGRPDGTWLAAVALTELGAAEMDHELALEQLKTTSGSLRPSSALDEDAWRKLAAPGVDDHVGAILRALLPAAVAMKTDELRTKKALFELDPRSRQDPASTATVVRTFAWTSQVLGIEVPELYVLEDVPGGVAAVQSVVPQTALGPQVVSGLGRAELAFIAARHLTYYRPEHYALVFYPTIPELSLLVLAALKLVMPKMPASKPIVQGAKRLGKALDALGEEARKKVEVAATALAERGGQLDLAAYVRGVELTAHRAGLLVCGDLSVVMAQLRRETRNIADLSLDDKRGDLLSCCASSDFSDLRARLGIAARYS